MKSYKFKINNEKDNNNENNNKNEINDKKIIVSFPHIGNYYIPIYNLLNNIVDKEKVEILIPSKITSNTITKGSEISPDLVCTPFKYNMGNFIESLEKGANVLIQAGGGCRYGYYYEVQEKLLKDMGYNFTFISLCDEKNLNILDVYSKMKILNGKLKFREFVYYFLLCFRMINILDEFERFFRENYALQKNKNEYDIIQKQMLEEFKNVRSMRKLNSLKKKYKELSGNVKLRHENENDIKIGIVGELYSQMEPFSSFYLEKELSKLNCIVKRNTTATYLLFKKRFSQRKVLKDSKDYISYGLGADGAESIAHTLNMINDGYDGIIHIKPFGCMPEINAMPILQKINNDTNIPIMYLTFDEQTSSTGINTRIEAFYDMIKMKKEIQSNKDNALGEDVI